MSEGQTASKAHRGPVKAIVLLGACSELSDMGPVKGEVR